VVWLVWFQRCSALEQAAVQQGQQLPAAAAGMVGILDKTLDTNFQRWELVLL
jgi:hypothetical protein